MLISNIRNIRWLLALLLFVAAPASAQWKSYVLGVKGDTLNRVDRKGLQQGPWVVRQEAVRGERGYEEEGVYQDGFKVGYWRRYSLDGDLLALEQYRWGMKDGKQVYFDLEGKPTREEMWRAVDPKSPYDTVPVRDLKDPNKITGYQIVKVEPVARKHGTWKFYNERDGRLEATQEWVMDKLKKDGLDDGLAPISVAGGGSSDSTTRPVTSVREATDATRPSYAKPEKSKVTKPPAVVDFEKKHKGRRKYDVRTGETGG
ncbi:toxin-antitoxin system YwqK family antitoxin [Flaviaesturariibacter terrae]